MKFMKRYETSKVFVVLVELRLNEELRFKNCIYYIYAILYFNLIVTAY